MDVFDFPYHTVQTKNPESGFRGQFGGSYVFVTPPTDPDQRIFTLHFPVMKIFTEEDGTTIDSVTNAKYNMKTLSDFYAAHKLWDAFQYNHYLYGTLVVRFNAPLDEPEGIPGGGGAVKAFTVELIEVP